MFEKKDGVMFMQHCLSLDSYKRFEKLLKLRFFFGSVVEIEIKIMNTFGILTWITNFFFLLLKKIYFFYRKISFFFFERLWTNVSYFFERLWKNIYYSDVTDKMFIEVMWRIRYLLKICSVTILIASRINNFHLKFSTEIKN